MHSKSFCVFDLYYISKYVASQKTTTLVTSSIQLLTDFHNSFVRRLDSKFVAK